MTIEIDLKSLRRFWDNTTAGELRFLLKLEWGRLPDLELMVEIAAGIEHSLQANGESQARVESWVLTKDGWSGVMRRATTTDDAMAWFEMFVADWSDGASGRVLGGPRSHRGPHDPGPALSTFVHYTTLDLRTLDTNARSRNWSVPDKITRYLAEQTITWSYLRGRTQFLNRDGRVISPVGDETAPALAHAIDTNTQAEYWYAKQTPFQRRGAGFWGQGQAIYQVADHTLGWQQRVAKAREVLLWTPPHTDLGFLRYMRTGYTAWHRHHQWAHVRENAVRYNTPLLSMLVPDVNGIQLLTDAHLERAHDLSAWTITHLNGGRHLVEAHDLEPWYANPQPDPDVLAHARADFGEMIMTRENILANQVWDEHTGWLNFPFK